MAGNNVKFIINSVCDGCGSCYFEFPNYFCEMDDGKAQAKEGVYVASPEEVSSVLAVCPCGAIEQVKVSSNIKQLLVDELDKLKNYKGVYPTEKDIPFKEEEYSIPIPYATGQNRYDYSSDSAANRAARSEFNSKMYSQIDAYILKVITEYRVKYMKAYYSKSEEDRSVYLKWNKEVSAILCNIAEMLKCAGKANDIPADFCEVNVFPKQDSGSIWKMLNKGELVADEMIASIKSEFQSNSYTDLSSYESYWDTDSMEVYAGTGLGGRIKYKDKYCYKNMHEAFRELANDLLNACYYKNDQIVERSLYFVKWLIDEYNEQLENLLKARVEYIEKKISLIKVESNIEHLKLDTYDNIVREIFYNREKNEVEVNGEPIEKQEAYITEYNGKQYFFDGVSIKERYIMDGVIRNQLISGSGQYDYNTIIGYSGYILFKADWTLWVFNCRNNSCVSIAEDVVLIYFYKDTVFYTTLYNSKRKFDNSNPGEIWCCKIDGSEKRYLKSTNSGNGLISINKIDDKKLYYTAIGTSTAVEGNFDWTI